MLTHQEDSGEHPWTFPPCYTIDVTTVVIELNHLEVSKLMDDSGNHIHRREYLKRVDENPIWVTWENPSGILYIWAQVCHFPSFGSIQVREWWWQSLKQSILPTVQLASFLQTQCRAQSDFSETGWSISQIHHTGHAGTPCTCAHHHDAGAINNHFTHSQPQNR